MDFTKSLADVSTTPVVGLMSRVLLADRLIIFNLHRIGTGDSFQEAFPVASLRKRLAFLLKLRFDFIGLDQVAECVRENGTLRDLTGGRPAVAFTVDDGYEDFQNAAPVFREFGCPVTVFLTTGFLDQEIWHWWDKVEWVVRTAPADSEVRLGPEEERFSWNSDLSSRQQAYNRLCAFLKNLPLDDFQNALGELEASTGSTVPATAPERYQPLDWDAVRQLAREGVTFGPHTVTHPILSKCDEGRAEFEIRTSRDRILQEVGNVLPILAYPNGDPASFGPRERSLVAEHGMVGGISTIQKYVQHDPRGFPDPFALPRFALPSEWSGFLAIVSGFVRVRPFVKRPVIHM